MARENPTWGYTRLVGALDNLGHQVGRNTVKRILERHGLEPAPVRGKRIPSKTFLRMHLGAIAAADFFSVEVLTVTGLVRYFVLFVIDLQTRRVQIAGVVRQPYGAWMTQVARNLTDGMDGFLLGKRYLLHDRDPLFTDEFRSVLAAAGVRCLRLPARSPDLNSFAERFVLSIKNECLSKLVPLVRATCGGPWPSTSSTITASATTKAWATGCSRPPNRRCDRPTGTHRSNAESGSAGCSTSTTGAPHEPDRLLAHDGLCVQRRVTR
jgi:transposase InsO family protein